jgi:hypothetical protein
MDNRDYKKDNRDYRMDNRDYNMDNRDYNMDNRDYKMDNVRIKQHYDTFTDHCCKEKVTKHFVCTVELHVTVNNIKYSVLHKCFHKEFMSLATAKCFGPSRQVRNILVRSETDLVIPESYS